MQDGSFSAAVFTFERVEPGLTELPIAARRALDHAGLRLSLEGWRSLPVDERRRLVIAGSVEVVDTGAVVLAIRRASPAAHSIERIADPDPITPPLGVSRSLTPPRALDGRTWARLRALDRYALAHAHRRAVARNDPALLSEAFDAIIPQRTASIPPPPMPGPAAPPRGGDEVPAPTRASAAPPPGEYFHSSRSSAPAPPRDEPRPPAGLGPDRRPPVDPGHPVSTHLTAGGEVRMVDIGGKTVTQRRAVATGSVRMNRDTISRLSRHDTPKGEVLAVARVAGIMAAKRTHELVPLCHPVGLTSVAVHMDIDAAAQRVNVTAIAESEGRTGVEMEALTAVSIACLTVYDMLKGIDREMVIGDIGLLEKSGGKTGHYRRDAGP